MGVSVDDHHGSVRLKKGYRGQPIEIDQKTAAEQRNNSGGTARITAAEQRKNSGAEQ
jgi:hypothetical protein